MRRKEDEKSERYNVNNLKKKNNTWLGDTLTLGTKLKFTDHKIFLYDRFK